jgi:hypothetical protein
MSLSAEAAAGRFVQPISNTMMRCDHGDLFSARALSAMSPTCPAAGPGGARFRRRAKNGEVEMAIQRQKPVEI